LAESEIRFPLFYQVFKLLYLLN